MATKVQCTFLLVLILGLACVSCAPVSTPTASKPIPTPTTESPAPTQAPDAEFTEPGFNLLVEVEGEVLLKRATWPDYHPTAFGAGLERGDLLKLSDRAQARVLCDNLSMWPVPGGVAAGLNNGCPQPPEPALTRAGAKVGSTRGVDPLVPYIISPRATKLLDNAPTLRWHDTGAASYAVVVRGGDLEWRQEQVTQTELVYPGQPAFKPGVSYLLVVEDSNGRSSQDEGLKGLGFGLLEEAEAEKVRADAGRIRGLGLSGEGEALALAQLYAGHGLVAEAIQILEGLVEGGSQQAAVHQALADLHTQIGLVYLAEPRYLEAVKLAEAEGNVEGLAAVQASLGEIYVELNNKDEAERFLTGAQAGYEALGDTQRAGELMERVAELNK
jgi:hypothetical protein